MLNFPVLPRATETRTAYVVLLAFDADEASHVRRLGRWSQSARPANHQQACSWHGRSTLAFCLLWSNNDRTTGQCRGALPNLCIIYWKVLNHQVISSGNR